MAQGQKGPRPDMVEREPILHVVFWSPYICHGMCECTHEQTLVYMYTHTYTHLINVLK